MSAVKILIVEDEAKVAESIKQGLEENAFEADIALNGVYGRDLALSNNYDAVILDINLPELNGYEVCGAIRKQNPRVPILMLTAFGTIENKTMGYDTGADDYLVKPFDFRELLLRLRSLLKRSGKSDTSGVLKIADLEIDTDAKEVRRAGTRISLTAKEYLLLEYLLRNKGRICSKADIAEKLWDHTFDTGTNVIEVYVNFLRKKIDRNFSPKLIHTYVGMGYVIKEDNG